MSKYENLIEALISTPGGWFLLIFLLILDTVLAPFFWLADLLTPPYGQA